MSTSYINTIILPGSATYYSLSGLPSNQRTAISAILIFYQEIKSALTASPDPTIVQAKLNWWRSEIAKLSLGQPSHPVVLMLQKSLQEFAISPQSFVDLIDALAFELTLPEFATFQDMLDHLKRTAVQRDFCIARVLSQDRKPFEKFTLAYELIDQIQNLHRDMQKHLLYFSAAEVQEFGVDFHADKTTDALRQLLTQRAERARVLHQEALQGLPSEDRRVYRYFILRNKLALATLDEIQKSGFPVLEKYITLTPLRYWWLALLT